MTPRPEKRPTSTRSLHSEIARVLVGECKWRNSFDESAAIEALEHRSTLLKGFTRCYYALFTKRDVSEGTHAKALARDDLRIVTLDDLYGRLG